MKSLKLILVSFVIAMSLVSCDKEEVVIIQDSPEEVMESISAKWAVSGNSMYESFEFNKSGSYLVIQKESKKSDTSGNIHFGTYTVIDGKTIVLSGFGTITLTERGEQVISISVKLEGSEEVTVVNATKVTEMESSSNLELLCKTWILVRTEFDEEIIDDYLEEELQTIEELTVLFSAAGTYFVTITDDEEEESNIANWKWKNEDEIELLYSREYDELGNVIWDEDDAKVIITELSASKLTIVDDEATYYLEPLTTENTTAKKSKGLYISRKPGQGIF